MSLMLPACTRPPAEESKVNLLTEHFCGLCYYYLLCVLPCLCVTAQLLPYMELICHNRVKAGLVTEVPAVFLTANGGKVIRKQKGKKTNASLEG